MGAKEGQPQIKATSGEFYFQQPDGSWEAIGEITSVDCDLWELGKVKNIKMDEIGSITFDLNIGGRGNGKELTSKILMKGEKEVDQKVNDLMCESGIPLSIRRRFDMMPNADKEVVYYFVGKAIKEHEEKMRKDAIKHASEDWAALMAYVREDTKSTALAYKQFKELMGMKMSITPKKIIFSGPKCIVLWEDGTKTIVSLSEKDDWNEYDAFCAALAKKIFGTTSAVHRIVDKKSNAKEFKEILKWKTKNLFNGPLSDLTDGLSSICKSFKKDGEGNDDQN